MNVRLPRDGMPSVRGKTLIVVVSVVAFVAMNVATRINQSFEEQKIEIEKLKRELKNASIKYQELHKKLDEASSQPSQQAELTADKCRDVFSTKVRSRMAPFNKRREQKILHGPVDSFLYFFRDKEVWGSLPSFDSIIIVRAICPTMLVMI